MIIIGRDILVRFPEKLQLPITMYVQFLRTSSSSSSFVIISKVVEMANGFRKEKEKMRRVGKKWRRLEKLCRVTSPDIVVCATKSRVNI